MGGIVAVIPARFGSTRFPGKPLALILGKTLLQRTLERAQQASCLDRIVVATDDPRIRDHVLELGGEVVMTPSSCPTGTDRMAAACRQDPSLDAAEIVVNIQGDEPLLDPGVIHAIVEALQNSDAVMSTPTCPLLSQEEYLSRHIVKCVADQRKHALYFSRAPIGSFAATQGPCPSVRRHVGLYAYRRSFLELYGKLPPSPLQLAEDLEPLKVLEHGYAIRVVEVAHSSIGVDIPEDIHRVESFLWNQNISSSPVV